MKCCINGGNVIRLLFLSAKLLKFEIQKSGQILCVHKPYFLMPGHILAICLVVERSRLVRVLFVCSHVQLKHFKDPSFSILKYNSNCVNKCAS